MCKQERETQEITSEDVGSMEDVLQRAKKYLSKCAPAIQGECGHNALSSVAAVAAKEAPADV